MKQIFEKALPICVSCRWGWRRMRNEWGTSRQKRGGQSWGVWECRCDAELCPCGCACVGRRGHRGPSQQLARGRAGGRVPAGGGAPARGMVASPLATTSAGAVVVRQGVELRIVEIGDWGSGGSIVHHGAASGKDHQRKRRDRELGSSVLTTGKCWGNAWRERDSFWGVGSIRRRRLGTDEEEAGGESGWFLFKNSSSSVLPLPPLQLDFTFNPSLRCFQDFFFLVYYESIKWEPKIRGIYMSVGVMKDYKL